MKSLPRRLFSAFAVAGLLAVASHAAGLQEGHPDLKSIGPLAFGPDGVLFAADTNSAAIFAIATNDTAGGADVYIHDDEWSISTSDGSLAAHFEHTVAVTAAGPRILTGSGVLVP